MGRESPGMAVLFIHKELRKCKPEDLTGGPQSMSHPTEKQASGLEMWLCWVHACLTGWKLWVQPSTPHKQAWRHRPVSSTGARSQENQKSGVILAYTVSLRQALNMRHCFKKKRENKINKKGKRTAKTALQGKTNLEFLPQQDVRQLIIYTDAIRQGSDTCHTNNISSLKHVVDIKMSLIIFSVKKHDHMS